MFQMMGVFAEFERAMIQARIVSGLDRARAEGKRLGRPTISAEIEDAIRLARANGLGVRATARQCGVGTATVRRVGFRS